MPPRSQRTLLYLLKSLIGQRVTVELRNEVSLKGKLISVDDSMSIKMLDVSSKGVQVFVMNLFAKLMFSAASSCPT